jgi:3'-phosphoadenosine 5'-phosphosulfate sulfotransferase (PAPS reductase)/FAD synthetase
VDQALKTKAAEAVTALRDLWERLQGKWRFVAFSTGKDSLALAAMLYEAVQAEEPICLYAHHNLEFPTNLEYLDELGTRGFRVEVVEPFLGFFELMERGIGFLTLKDAWCVPMLVGTGLVERLQRQGLRNPQQAVMFRGMSGAEFSHKWHSRVELYGRLDLPTVNPLLHFTRDEILTIIKDRYGLPLNPIYRHMDRTYCICCYTSDARRQAYSRRHYPDVCRRYYGQIEEMLFHSGLIERVQLEEKYRTREEKLDRHGFVHWNRIAEQNVVGAVRRRKAGGVFCYRIRDPKWINTKHLQPVRGRWLLKGTELRFWDIKGKVADCLINRMINCLDCGFCVVECFPCRRFDRETKTLKIDGCVGCGKCLRLKFCMGWRHRFRRRVIVEENGNG